MLRQFLEWFLAPVLDALLRQEVRVQETVDRIVIQFNRKFEDQGHLIAAVDRRIDGIIIPDHSFALADIKQALEWPRLSIQMLMTWEAINYAANKWDKDPLGPKLRESEVFQWASRFLEESKWPAPDKALLCDLLAVRDTLKNTRYSQP